MPPERPAPATTRQVVRDVRRRLADLGTRPERDPAEWERLRGLLDAVDSADRNRAWREASVLADLAFRQRPTRTYKQLRQIRERRLERGAADEFDRFWQECRRALAPYTLTPHGYSLALDSRDPDDLWRAVADVTAHFGALGHVVLVNSGTLLGLVRDGTVLGHDDDVDLAVVLGRDDSPDAAGAAREWRELRVRAAEAGLLDVDFERHRPSHCRVVTEDGLKIDLFPAWQGGDRMFVWPHTYGEVAAADVLPPEQRRIGPDGPVVLLPRRPEPLLESNYGPGWRVPDPTYRFDWDRAHQRFAGFLGHLGSRRGAGAEPPPEPPEPPEPAGDDS